MTVLVLLGGVAVGSAAPAEAQISTAPSAPSRPTPAATKAAAALAEARQFYNQQQYEQAIRAATEARAFPALASAASVVIARAHLDRYRQAPDAADLSAAREMLRVVDAAALEPRDQLELLVALGLSLYLDDTAPLVDRFSAAAAQFELALARTAPPAVSSPHPAPGGSVGPVPASGLRLDEPSRARLFDWWAGSLDRAAQAGPEDGRRAIYARLLAAADAELAADPTRLGAAYWLAAAAWGLDDLPRAVGVAVAAWMRAGTAGVAATFRDDLDRLMRQVILPERARDLGGAGDARALLAQLDAEWAAFKARWQ